MSRLPSLFIKATTPALLAGLMLFASHWQPADAAELHASASSAGEGYAQPVFDGPEDYIQFSELPARTKATADEQEPRPEDISASELLHAYGDTASGESGGQEALLGSAGEPGSDILSPLTMSSMDGKGPVDRNIKMFSVNIKDRFSSWLSRSGKYVGLMKDVFREHGMPEDLVYIALIESGFNPKAYSWAKASGPWQFISSTGKRYGLRIDSWVDERRDPVKSTKAAAAYLKDLYNMFGTWSLSMAAYNAGEGSVSRAINKTGTLDFWKISESRNIVTETREYVPKFIAAKAIANDPAAYGFDKIFYEEPLKFDEVRVNKPVSLDAVARACGVSLDEIKGLNPELKRSCTPPNTPGYRLKVPHGAGKTFLAKYESLPESAKKIVAYNGKTGTYKVRKGDTLSKIARKHGMSTTRLASLNGLKSKSYIRAGQRLKVTGKTIVAASASSGRYRVRNGDTLWEISQKFGVSMNSIKKVNSIGRRSVIKPGQRLVIPST